MSQELEATTADAPQADVSPQAETAITADNGGDESLDAALDAAFEALQADDEPGDGSDEPEAEEVEAEAEVEAKPTAAYAPNYVPKAVREAWGDMPEAAQKAVADAHRDLANKATEVGRVKQGLQPIEDVLVKAAQTFPEMVNKKPGEIAGDIFRVAEWGARFNSDPVSSIMQMVDSKPGLREHFFQAIVGQGDQGGNNPQLISKIAELESQLKQVSDPQNMRSMIEGYTSEMAVVNDVERFSAEAEHWGVVQDHIPAAIQFQRQAMPGASKSEILKAAYDLAVSQVIGPVPAKVDDTAKRAVKTPDPEKARAAKNVNIKGRPSTPRSQTLDEALEATYRRATA